VAAPPRKGRRRELAGEVPWRRISAYDARRLRSLIGCNKKLRRIPSLPGARWCAPLVQRWPDGEATVTAVLNRLRGNELGEVASGRPGSIPRACRANRAWRRRWHSRRGQGRSPSTVRDRGRVG
jgi:hypothetical protein